MTIAQDLAKERTCVRCGHANDPKDSDGYMEQLAVVGDDGEIDDERFWVHVRCLGAARAAEGMRSLAVFRRAIDDGEFDHVLKR